MHGSGTICIYMFYGVGDIYEVHFCQCACAVSLLCVQNHTFLGHGFDSFVCHNFWLKTFRVQIQIRVIQWLCDELVSYLFTNSLLMDKICNQRRWIYVSKNGWWSSNGALHMMETTRREDGKIIVMNSFLTCSQLQWSG